MEVQFLNVLPLPSSESIIKCPPKLWIVCFTTSNPTPRPERSDTTSAVLNPGWKIKSNISRSVNLFLASDSVTTPFLIAFSNTFPL